ncbi:MAG: hydrolase [Patescibacteria group bacterium]|nr:hydrolase [Patescibacteria group bacterium]
MQNNSSLFSVWIIPEVKDREYLQNIINNLAKKYNSPVFIPHMTLAGDIRLGIDEIESAVEEIFENTKPFKIKKTRVNQSELFFKTVFIEFGLDENLKNLYSFLSRKIRMDVLFTFKPHISLIYKIMPREEKLKIIEKLDIKDEFTIGSVMINKNDPNDYQNVKSWKIIYSKKLS